MRQWANLLNLTPPHPHRIAFVFWRLIPRMLSRQFDRNRHEVCRHWKVWKRRRSTTPAIFIKMDLILLAVAFKQILVVHRSSIGSLRKRVHPPAIGNTKIEFISDTTDKCTWVKCLLRASRVVCINIWWEEDLLSELVRELYSEQRRRRRWLEETISNSKRQRRRNENDSCCETAVLLFHKSIDTYLSFVIVRWEEEEESRT